MNNKSRTENTLRNFIVGIGAQLFQYTLAFATRTVFIILLPVEYLGVNGLFTNILAVLSLAEMGVGGAFMSLLYKPLHENDTEKLKSLMTAFKKGYALIGFVVAVAGLSLFPFLDLIIKENNIENISLIYLIFLTGSVTSYFYAHKIAFISANQKLYIQAIYAQVFTTIQYTLQIIILLLTKNFILYLIIQILCPIAGNFVLAGKVNRLYPFLKQKGVPLDKETRTDLLRKVIAGFYHHGGYVLATSTDSIVISAFLGVYWVGIYSNYLLVISVISAFITLTFNSVSASIGNLVASSDKTRSFETFQKIQFLNFLLAGFSSVCFITLFNPFINLWIGSKFLLNQCTVILIVIMFYTGLFGMQKSINIFKETTGLFYNDRYAGLIEGLLNILASIYLVQHIGLAGVFVGTILAACATRLWVEPYVVFRHLFHRPVFVYYKNYLTYGLTTILTTAVVYYVTSFIPHDSWMGFFVMTVACIILTIGIFVLLFFKRNEFKFFYEIFARGINKLMQSI